jgi:transcriptional regulator with XRE-family HTH domain
MSRCHVKKVLKLRKVRESKGLSQAALGKLVGADQPSIYRWEKGKVKPWPHTVQKLADALDCMPAELL